MNGTREENKRRPFFKRFTKPISRPSSIDSEQSSMESLGSISSSAITPLTSLDGLGSITSRTSPKLSTDLMSRIEFVPRDDKPFIIRSATKEDDRTPKSFELNPRLAARVEFTKSKARSVLPEILSPKMSEDLEDRVNTIGSANLDLDTQTLSESKGVSISKDLKSRVTTSEFSDVVKDTPRLMIIEPGFKAEIIKPNYLKMSTSLTSRIETAESTPRSAAKTAEVSVDIPSSFRLSSSEGPKYKLDSRFNDRVKDN